MSLRPPQPGPSELVAILGATGVTSDQSPARIPPIHTSLPVTTGVIVGVGYSEGAARGRQALTHKS